MIANSTNAQYGTSMKYPCCSDKVELKSTKIEPLLLGGDLDDKSPTLKPDVPKDSGKKLNFLA